MEYKQITQEELEEILKEHKLWLESEGTKGKKANLYRTDLRNVNLKYTNLRYADLKYADLRYTYLPFANLYNVNLESADLKGANLYRTDLRNADLEGTNLINANLKGANLINANLEGAELYNADLRYAYLKNANLKNVNLKYANVDFVEGFYTIGNIGTFKGNIIYCVYNNTVYAGCWEGNLEDFLEKGLEMNKHHVFQSRAIRIAYDFFIHALEYEKSKVKKRI